MPCEASGTMPPSDSGVLETLSLPAYWDGAVATRLALGGGDCLARAIAEKLRQGLSLDEIDEYQEWRARAPAS